jgi:fluoride exporter
MTPYVWAAVGCIGGAAAVARFLLDGAIGARLGGAFPWGTFTINVSGSIALGILVGAAVSGTAFVLAGTAALGSYTTFSTWMFETHRLGEDDDRMPLAANIVGSVAAGLAAAYLGLRLGRGL